MTTTLRIVSENWVKCDDVTVKFYHDSAVTSLWWVGPGTHRAASLFPAAEGWGANRENRAENIPGLK